MKKDGFILFVKNFREETQKNIIELAKTNLENKEKKQQLDSIITDFVLGALDKITLSGLVKLLIKKFVLPNIAEITQIIYDLLKSKIIDIEKQIPLKKEMEGQK